MSVRGRYAGKWRATHSASSLAVALILVWLSSCSGTAPPPVGEPFYETRAVTRQRDGVAVTAGPLSDHEGRAIFGVPLAVFNVQPVWIKIENRSAWPRWFFPISVDPDYYPPYEVARRVATFTAPTVEELYARLSKRAIRPFVAPGETVSGFVYAHADEGFKAFNVDLVGHHSIESFHFAVAVPGLETDADTLFGSEGNTPPSLDDDALRQWLRDMPCCTVAADGRVGDPLNIVLIGNLDTVRGALVSRRWDVTARLTTASLWRIANAFIFGAQYRYAPISALYVFERVQDITFQKPRNVINERNHMRLWRAPVSHRGQPVWVGQVSRDVGVKFSRRVWPPTTHVIDPDVDDARYYVVEDLFYGGHISRIGFVGGVGEASPGAPRRNAENDPYFTDGMRAVLFLSERSVPFAEVELLDWQYPSFMQSFRRNESATRTVDEATPD
jgi:LssY C-terminus